MTMQMRTGGLASGLLAASVLALSACAGGDASPAGFGVGTGTGGGGPGPGDGGTGGTGDGSGTGSSGGTSSGGTSSGSTGDDSGTDTGGTGTGDDGGTDTGSTGTGTGTEPPAECGNGAAETGEDCDGGDLGGATCESEGFADGALACNPDCTFDTGSCTMCGNDNVDAGEECDGTDLGDLASCEDVGLGGPTEPLLCNPNCTYNYSQCSGCPDGTIVDPEECEPQMGLDPPNLNGEDCTTLGFDGGTLACDTSCTFNTAGCHLCGDNVAAGPEECDGADFAGASCGDYPSQAGPNFTGGTLTCDASCTISTENCTYCGDGLITGNETCDGQNVDTETCADQGWTDGTLACNATCNGYDVSGCTFCGDSVAEGNEQCDMSDLDGADCISQGYDAGDLDCTNECLYDESGCIGFACGDGMITGQEECDCGAQGSPCTAAELDNKNCTNLDDPTGDPFSGGTLDCNSPANCTFDTSGCWWCGNNTKEGTEDCDGGVGGNNCTTIGQGFTAGTLACDPDDCTWNTSGCTTCGNGIPEPGEVCDGGVGSTTCPDVNPAYVGGTLTCNQQTCTYNTSGCTDGVLNNTNNNCGAGVWCNSGGIGQGAHADLECFVSPPLTPPFDLTNVTYEVGVLQAIPTTAQIEVYQWNGVGPGTVIGTQALNATLDLLQGAHSIPTSFTIPGGSTGFCVGIAANQAFALTLDQTSSSGTQSFIRAPSCGATSYISLASIPYPGNWCITATIEP